MFLPIDLCGEEVRFAIRNEIDVFCYLRYALDAGAKSAIRNLLCGECEDERIAGDGNTRFYHLNREVIRQ